MSVQRFGRYEIERELGWGGMAVVYLARDPFIKREVAIKVLPRQSTADPHFRARFQREAEVIAALDHPYIVPIYDFGEHDAQLFIVMRYLPGGSLHDRLARGPLNLPDLARIVRRVAEALDAAHAQHIIHRDLKPGNILFDARGEAFLSDFGIAKVAEASAALTGAGLIGTPEYMSPEQVRGEKNLDSRSDVYSLGVVLFHALTEQLPYKAETPLGTALAHLTEPAPRILSVRPDLPVACETIVARALAKDPADRYPTAGELARQVSLLAAEQSEHAARWLSAQAPFEPLTAPAPVMDVGPQSGAPTAAEPLTAPIPAQPTTPAPATTTPGRTSPTVPLARWPARLGAWVIAAGAAAFFGLFVVALAAALYIGRRESQPTSALPAVAVTSTVPAPTGTPGLITATQPPPDRAATATAQAQMEGTTAAAQAIQATASARSRWPVLFSDSFSSDVGDWPVGDSRQERITVNMLIFNGKYRWNATAHRGVNWKIVPDSDPVSDFYLTVEARRLSGPTSGQYGVVFRAMDDQNYYLFVIRDDQRFAFYILYDNEWTNLTALTSTSAVRPDEANRVTVSAEGSHFAFFINDQFVGEAYDSRLRSGQAGLAIDLDADVSAVFEFDNFELRAP